MAFSVSDIEAAAGDVGLADPRLLRRQCLVGGAWIDADDGATAVIRSPADDQFIATVPVCGRAETRRAIDAAAAALPAWSRKTAGERARLLRRWFDLCIAAQDDLARILTLEQGKPLAEAKGEIAYGSSFIEWFAEEAKRAYGDVIPSPDPSRRIIVLKQPVGVVGAITPWNFPNAMITRKAGAALAAGCTIVIKPAPSTPLSALAIGWLAEAAGIPAGVFNVVTGDAAAIGGELTGNPIVRKISFTGSTAIGRLLMRQSADTVKRVSMELGGNAPFIVFDDADIDQALAGVMASKFRNAGQTCVCANRIFVQDGIYDAFAARLKTMVAALSVGNGLEPGVTIGPLINQAAVDKVEAHVRDACERGATVVLGGKPHALGGYFYEPTILVDVDPASRLMREETFGPVAPLIRFTGEADRRARQRHRIRARRLCLHARPRARLAPYRSARIRHRRSERRRGVDSGRAVRGNQTVGRGASKALATASRNISRQNMSASAGWADKEESCGSMAR